MTRPKLKATNSHGYMDGQNQKLLVDQLRRVFLSSDRLVRGRIWLALIGSDWLGSTGKLEKLDFMYGDETEIVFINSMKDSFEKCCRFTSITNLHDKYGHGKKTNFHPFINFFLDSDLWSNRGKIPSRKDNFTLG